MKRKRIFWKRWLLLALLLVILTATAYGQITVSGPNESLAGDLVVITVAGDDQQKCDGDVCTVENASYVWNVTPPELVEGKFWIGDGGRTVTFASRLPGTYYFTVASSAGGTLQMLTHRLDNITAIPGPVPLPPVPPEPTPEPTPPININAEISALKELAKTKAVELVKSQYFDREKKALAESFLTTAKLIDNGTITATADARTKQRDNSRRYLSSVARNSWQQWQAWDETVAKRLAEIDATNAMTVEQIGQAYKQIGLGLQP